MAPVQTAERATSSTLYFGPWYRRSPFFEKTLDAGCSAYDIYNHMYLPGYYADPVEEYWHLLNAVTVWDVSVERIVEISGPDASAFVNTLTCRDLTKCAVGQGKYVLITAEDGGIVNDPVLLRVEENRWWLALADSDAGLWARGVAVHSGMDVKVREPEIYPIQVQGPKSKDVMQTLFGDAVLGIKYYWTLTTDLDGIPVVISRTGWTGEVGYEIYLMDPSRGGELWDRVMAAGKPHDIRPIAPCEARRIEAGIFNYNSDMTIANNPFEIMGLERLVEPQAADYIGKAALEEIRVKGVSRKLVGIEVEGDALSFEIAEKRPALHQGEKVGHITDLIWSPRLEKNIGYVWVPIELSAAGIPLEIENPDGSRWAARTAAIPFLDAKKDIPKGMTTSPGLLTEAEIEAVRQPYRAARLLPGRAYHDPAFFAFERERFFGRDWQIVGREEDVPAPGSYILATVDDEPLIVLRGRDNVIRAFYNVCQHRGTAVAEEPCGTVVRLQCPYHAWIYDLEGNLVRAKHTDDLAEFDFGSYGLKPVRLARWGGFLFVTLAENGPFLEDQLGDLVDHFARFDLASLRSARSATYEVGANWKFIAENYSECYHCPGIHPQLNRLTPYDTGGDFNPEGEWQGGWMELVADAETMALQGGHRGGRPPMRGATALDERRITYYLMWPNVFLSIHPDYLLVHKLTPTGPDHTKVECWWLFEPETIAREDFDPTDAVEFWDLTNRQDWHVCELQQQGTRSRSWVSGRYSNIEPSVHAFDLMVVDRYADDGIISARTVRHTYDVPPEDVDPVAAGLLVAPGASAAGPRRADARSLASRN